MLNCCAFNVKAILANKRRSRTARMLDTNEQLSRLRQRIAAIDQRFAAKSPSLPRLQPAPARWFIEQWAEGEVVRNGAGEHFQMERLFARHKRHGSADIGALAELPHDFLN